MNMKTKDAGKIVFKMLGFQYKPVEKRMLANITPEQKKQYFSCSYARRIAILDGMVARGL